MRYEEPYQKRSSRTASRRRPSFGGWLGASFLKLLALLLILLILTVGVLYALPVSLLAVEPEGVELSLTDGLPENRLNVLLLGLDALRESHQRSDAVLIASISRGDVKLVSVLRDTVVPIPGHGEGKLNAAYSYGGPELVMRTLNEVLRLNLMHYAAVDFTALAYLVDALGGVDLDLTEAERAAVNELINAKRAQLSALGYTAPDLAQSGEHIRLNGVQALAYARVRKLDSDFGRANRQRKLLTAMRARLRSSLWNPVALYRVARVLFTSVNTDLTPLQLISLGLKVLAAPPPAQLRLPVDGAFTDDGSALHITNPDLNTGALQDFLYNANKAVSNEE